MNARVCLGIALALAGCSKSEDINTQPASVPGTLRTATYDGTTNDLLTGGIGKSGLGSGTAPGFADGNTPTAAELRTRAIYVNYRALVDFTANGGYGTFWGPNVDVNGGNRLRGGTTARD